MIQNLAQELESRLAEKSPAAQQPPVPGDDDPREEEIAAPEDDPRESETAADAAEPEEVGDDTPEQDEADAAQQTYTPQSLADAIGWEASELYETLQVPFADGESMSLGQLKDARDEALRMRQEVEQQKAQIEQERAQLQQSMIQGPSQVSAEVQQAQDRLSEIKARYSSVDWEGLEQSDPGRAANERQKFAMQYSHAEAGLQQAQGQQQQQQQQAWRQIVTEQDYRLAQLVPQWQKAEVYQDERAKVGQFLVDRMGFQPQEVQAIYHGPARATAYYAWKYFEGQRDVEQAKEKVRKAPKKVLKPGRGKMPDKGAAQVKNLVEKARKTHNKRDRVAAAKAILGQRLPRK